MVENQLKIASKTSPKLISGGPSWSSGGVLGGPWELFGSRTPPKRIEGLYRRLLGSSWAPSRGQVGGQKATMGSPGRRLESIFERLGCLLVRFFGIFMLNKASVSLFVLESLESCKTLVFLKDFIVRRQFLTQKSRKKRSREVPEAS